MKFVFSISFTVFFFTARSQINQQWATLSNPLSMGCNPVDMVVDDSGYVYTLAQTTNSFSYERYLTVKYSPTGNIIWENIYGPVASERYIPIGICLDDSGNVYSTGVDSFQTSGQDAVTIKYNSLGVQQWIRNGSGYYAKDIIADGNNIYVLGLSNIEKYNSAGNLLIDAPLTGSLLFGFQFLHQDKNKNLYVAGTGVVSGN